MKSESEPTRRAAAQFNQTLERIGADAGNFASASVITLLGFPPGYIFVRRQKVNRKL